CCLGQAVETFGTRPRDLLRQATHGAGGHRAAAEREATAADAAAAAAAIAARFRLAANRRLKLRCERREPGAPRWAARGRAATAGRARRLAQEAGAEITKGVRAAPDHLRQAAGEVAEVLAIGERPVEASEVHLVLIARREGMAKAE